MPSVTVATEGLIDSVVIRRICQEVDVDILAVYGERGKDALDGALSGYNAAARYGTWFVLRDLDADAECAPSLRRLLIKAPTRGMSIRIAVRAVESWLIADRQSFARYFSVPASRITLDPESLDRPKDYLVNLARRSRSRAIRDDVVPRAGSKARVGPGYAGRVIEFVATAWSPAEARVQSDSLNRCLERLSQVRTP